MKSKSVENLPEVFLGFTFNMVGVELKCNYGSLKQINIFLLKKWDNQVPKLVLFTNIEANFKPDN